MPSHKGDFFLTHGNPPNGLNSQILLRSYMCFQSVFTFPASILGACRNPMDEDLPWPPEATRGRNISHVRWFIFPSYKPPFMWISLASHVSLSKKMKANEGHRVPHFFGHTDSQVRKSGSPIWTSWKYGAPFRQQRSPKIPWCLFVSFVQ